MKTMGGLEKTEEMNPASQIGQRVSGGQGMKKPKDNQTIHGIAKMANLSQYCVF